MQQQLAYPEHRVGPLRLQGGASTPAKSKTECAPDEAQLVPHGLRAVKHNLGQPYSGRRLAAQSASTEASDGARIASRVLNSVIDAIQLGGRSAAEWTVAIHPKCIEDKRGRCMGVLCRVAALVPCCRRDASGRAKPLGCTATPDAGALPDSRGAAEAVCPY